MTTYTIEGQDFDAPDEMTMPDVVDAYGRWKASQAPQKAPEATTPQEAPTPAPDAPPASTGFPERKDPASNPYFSTDHPYNAPQTKEEIAAKQAELDKAHTERMAYNTKHANDTELVQTSFDTSGNPVFENMPVSDKGIHPDDMVYDPDWLDSAKTDYIRRNGKIPPDMTDKQVSDAAIENMGWYDVNSVRMAVDSVNIRSGTPEEKKAFLYLVDNYPNINISVKGMTRFVEASAADPVNASGLLTLGASAVAAKMGLQGAKLAVRSMLRGMVTTHFVEGALINMGQDSIHQNARINADGQKDFSYGEAGVAALIGGAAGATLGAVTHRLGASLANSPKPEFEPRPKMETRISASDVVINKTEAPKFEDGRTVDDLMKGKEPVVKSDTPVAGDKVAPEGNPILDAIRQKGEDPEYIKNVRNPDGSTNKEKVSIEASHITDKILNHPTADLERVVNEAHNAPTSGIEPEVRSQAIKDAATQTFDKAKEVQDKIYTETDPNKRNDLMNEQMDLQQRLAYIRKADESLSSQAGRELGKRADTTDFIAANRDISAQNLMIKDGINPDTATPSQWNDYSKKFYDLMEGAHANAEANSKVIAYDKPIQDAYNQGDVNTAVQLHSERQLLIDSIVDGTAASQNWSNRIGEVGNTVSRVASELMISNILGAPTQVRITMSAIYRTLTEPVLRMITNGASIDTVRTMVAQYVQGVMAIPMAARRAAFTFMTEKHMLSVDGIAFYERPSPMIPRWAGGGIVRTFPRLLEANHEFFMNLNYRMGVVGDAMGKALYEAHQAGSEIVDKAAHISNAVSDALDNSFAKNIDAPRVIDELRRQGMSNGMSGDELQAWVKNQLYKNGDLYKQATDQAGKDYVADQMFTRKFSGDDVVSRLAKSMQNGLNSSPLSRILVAPFFVTPIRVFEYIAKTTPGLQFLAANPWSNSLWKDLSGARGEANRMRANAQMLTSFAATFYILNKYSEGNASGAGPVQTGDRRMLEDTKQWQANSIKTKDGYTDMTRIEPLGGNFRIIATLLDKWREADYRQAQGDNVNHEHKDLLSHAGVAATTVYQFLKDSPMMQGAMGWVDAANLFSDPEKNEDRIVHLLGRNMKSALPNGYLKYEQDQHPSMNDPQSLNQYWSSYNNPDDPTVVKQYDALGNVRKVENTFGKQFGSMYQDQDTKQAGTSATDRRVIQQLSNIEIKNGIQKFIPPHTIQLDGFKGIDLRKMPYPNDPNNKADTPAASVYDKWMQEFSHKEEGQETSGNAMKMDNILTMLKGRPAMSKSDHADSTATNVSSALTELRLRSFMQMVQKNPELQQRMRDGAITHSENINKPDPTGQPYKTGE